MTPNSAESPARDLYVRLLDAWNRRDAEEFAALFADDGTMIGFDGSQASGVEAQNHLRPIFDDHPTASYVAKVREIRPLGASNVLLRAIVGMIPPGQHNLNPAVNALQTLIAEHQKDGWRIVLFQNTPAQYHGRPDLVEQHTAELQELVSSDTSIA